MQLYDTHCCAFQEISGVSYGDPLDLMKSFCGQALNETPRYRSQYANVGTLYSFYIFSDVSYSRGAVTNGHKFAAFIKENKLGQVITTPAVSNRAFHDDHSNVVWIWMPNVKNLKAWWQAEQAKGSRRCYVGLL